MKQLRVRLYDFDTGVITTIPARELAPGMIRASVQGIEGDVWVPVDALKLGTSRPQHPPFCAEVRKTLRSIHRTIKEVYPVSFELWEGGFRRDTHPEQEIALWKVIADGFQHFTAGRAYTPEQKQDIFNILLGACNCGKDIVHYVTDPLTLSKAQIDRIARYFTKHHNKVGAIRDSLLWSRQGGHNKMAGEHGKARVYGPVPLEALLKNDHPPDSDPRPAFRFADVVLGTDTKSTRNAIVFGRTTLERAQRRAPRKPVLIVRVSIDEDTDDLEKLCALCQVRKGRHEFDGTCVIIGTPSDADNEEG
jgi:hypothetical protein